MARGGYGRNYSGRIIIEDSMEGFKDYLRSRGYSEYTPSGNTSTIYDYCRWVKRICERENVSLEELEGNIIIYVAKYDDGGQEEIFGAQGHNAARNSLKRYKEYLQNR